MSGLPDAPWHDNALHNRRQWLGDVQPWREDTDDGTDDGTDYTFTWGPECDDAIAARRALDREFDAAFTLAESDGIGILPAYTRRGNVRVPHILMEMAYSCDDADWLIVTRRGGHADYTADVLAATRLAPSAHERHDTPTWCVIVTHH